MKRFKQVPMSEQQFNEMQGIEAEAITPLLIILKRNSVPISPTFDNYKKVTAPKKAKAVKEPRVVMTKEEARLRRNQRQRERMATVRPTSKPRKILTDEERLEYKRKYMEEWRKNNPRNQTEANLKWRKANPELNKIRRREESRRRRERQKEKKDECNNLHID